MLEAIDEPLRVPKLDLVLWFFLAAVCGAAIFGSVKASKAYVKTYDANVKKIVAADKSLAKATKAERGGLRPNAALVKDINGRRESLNKQLLELWQALYDRQAKFLVWPKGAGFDLSEAKAEGGKKKAGGKAKKKNDFSEPICKIYNDSMVRSEFERIFSKLDLRRPGKQGGSLDGLPFKDQPADFDGVVAWDPAQREAMIARRYLAKGIPSGARVKLVQEDLWLFESLVDVLAPLNGNAKDTLSAPLKQIDVLDVAQWATAWCQQQEPAIWMPEASVKPAATGKPPAAPAEEVTDEALLNGRYLDEKGQPLRPGAQQPFAEFKQIFVYMKIVMDQRRLTDLLTGLANAALPVEVRHIAVQVLPDSTLGEATPAGDVGSLSVAETTAWDANVEIGGVIYLYNPPSAKKLGSGAAKSPALRTFRIPTPGATAPAK